MRTKWDYYNYKYQPNTQSIPNNAKTFSFQSAAPEPLQIRISNSPESVSKTSTVKSTWTPMTTGPSHSILVPAHAPASMESKYPIPPYSKTGTVFSGAPIIFSGSIALVTTPIPRRPLFLIGKWRKKRSCRRLTTPFKMLSLAWKGNTRRTNNLRSKNNDKNTKSIFSNWKATCPHPRLIRHLCHTILSLGLVAKWLPLRHRWCHAWKNGDNKGT